MIPSVRRGSRLTLGISVPILIETAGDYGLTSAAEIEAAEKS
jgi:hypothetical protein